MRTITTDLLHQFVEKRQREGAKNATINRNLSLLRRMINLARRRGRSIQAPYFPMLKENNIRKGFIIPAQFIELRDTMPDHLRPLMTFLYFTGCRVGVALAITWSQIEFEKERFQLRIEGTKRRMRSLSSFRCHSSSTRFSRNCRMKAGCLMREICGSLFKLRALR